MFYNRMTFWLVHGLVINDYALIVANSISVALASALLFYKIKKDYFRRQTKII